MIAGHAREEQVEDWDARRSLPHQQAGLLVQESYRGVVVGVTLPGSVSSVLRLRVEGAGGFGAGTRDSMYTLTKGVPRNMEAVVGVIYRFLLRRSSHQYSI